MHIMIVDDEELALSRLRRLLNEEGIENITTFNNPTEALIAASKESFDVCFLDISMPQMSGLELANALVSMQPNIFVIFQTAYSEHALDAFECGSIDFLVKPIEVEHIKRVLTRINHFHKEEHPEEKEKRLIGKRGSRLYLISPEDIYYIQADLDEVIIRIDQTDVSVKRKISDLEKLLKGKNFFRIHRSIIVNVDRIKSMESVEQSKLQIAFKGIDDVVTSSKDGAKEFREFLEEHSL